MQCEFFFPRYASKSVIANTYMGRLGNAALQRYQQLTKQLYNTMDFGNQAQGSSPHNSSEQNSAGAAGELRTAFNGQQPSASDSSGLGAGGGQGGMTHFGLVGSPNYPDIASDKGSYKSNTPKHIRRRHSDSGDEDLTKALQRADKAQQHALENLTEQGSSSSNSNSNNNASGSTTNAEAKFQQHPSGAGQRLGSESDGHRDKAPSSPTKGQSEEPADRKVVRRKKTILKGENRRKSLNRVSFDPLALLLDASLEGELDLVMRTAKEVSA